MCADGLGLTLRYILLVVLLGSALVMPSAAVGQGTATNKQSEPSDPWKPLRPFVGQWEGESQGEPGVGKMERTYTFVLRERFVQVSNKGSLPTAEEESEG